MGKKKNKKLQFLYRACSLSLFKCFKLSFPTREREQLWTVWSIILSPNNGTFPGCVKCKWKLNTVMCKIYSTPIILNSSSVIVHFFSLLHFRQHTSPTSNRFTLLAMLPPWSLLYRPSLSSLYLGKIVSETAPRQMYVQTKYRDCGCQLTMCSNYSPTDSFNPTKSPVYHQFCIVLLSDISKILYQDILFFNCVTVLFWFFSHFYL